MQQYGATEKIIVVATIALIGLVVAFFVIRKPAEVMVVDFKEQASSQEGSDVVSQLPKTNSEFVGEEMNAAYQERVNQLLRQYNPESINYEAAAIAYPAIEADLLALEVPPLYQELHLALVLNFERMISLQTAVIEGDPAARAELAAIQQTIAALPATYPWLEL